MMILVFLNVTNETTEVSSTGSQATYLETVFIAAYYQHHGRSRAPQKKSPVTKGKGVVMKE